jgi:hypothetical protein
VSVNSERSLETANHRVVKPWKCDQSANLNTGEFVKTAIRYTPLTEMHADNIGTIAVIVNGYISTKRNARLKNLNASRRTNGGIGEKKKKSSY